MDIYKCIHIMHNAYIHKYIHTAVRTAFTFAECVASRLQSARYVHQALHGGQLTALKVLWDEHAVQHTFADAHIANSYALLDRNGQSIPGSRSPHSQFSDVPPATHQEARPTAATLDYHV
jgi:hypothetical protein